jgi:hypothetical protein
LAVPGSFVLRGASITTSFCSKFRDKLSSPIIFPQAPSYRPSDVLKFYNTELRTAVISIPPNYPIRLQ